MTPEVTPLVRPQRGRMLAGVCAGLADHLGASVTWTRWVMVGLACLSGAGLIAYIFLWVLAPAGQDSETESTGDVGHSRRLRILVGNSWLRIGLLALIAGLVAWGLSAWAGLDAATLLPALFIAAGALAVWSQLESTTDASVTTNSSARGWLLARLVGGVVVAGLGLILLSLRRVPLGDLVDVLIGITVVLVGLSLIAAPAFNQLWLQLRAEQAGRVREAERADIAAHLHDSVMQTLALIQRSADNSEVTRLARAQERELRQWLFAGSAQGPSTLASALRDVAVEVEDRYGIPVELVVSGDGAMGEQPTVLVAAVREALINASVHAAPPISAYVEIGPTQAEAFVRDHGPGFELAAIPADRGGVRGSILGRIERHGGRARVRARANGMEIEMRLPMTPEVKVDEHG